ncbi:MAG: hypothetical protein V7L22_27860 [Nostoc sp.]
MTKGIPNKKILNSFLWGGHLARLWLEAGKDAHPTRLDNLFVVSP